MATIFPKPNHKFQTDDGFILPDHSNDNRNVRAIEEMQRAEQLSISRSFEYTQGMHGETKMWYTMQSLNDMKNICLDKCIDVDSLSTNNLSQKDKLCSKNCIYAARTYYNVSEGVNRKWMATNTRGENINF